ncbi:MAG: hypothetical protein EA369_00720 [Bradymonadales bacterium]|nr:MAG: hypothetical protein EA369_00720 [Bradymonadales bacterium]
MQRILLSIGLLLFSLAEGEARAASEIETDFGQNRLRQDFHQAQQLEELESFKNRYDFVDIAEAYWIHRHLRPEELPPQPLEISSALMHWRESITRSPLQVGQWGGALLKAFQIGFQRPVELMLALIKHTSQLQLPLFLCLLFLLFIHFLNWMPALQRDFTRLFGASSTKTVWFCLLFCIGLGLALKFLALSLFLLLCIASVYARRRRFFFSLSLLFAIAISGAPVISTIHSSLEESLAVEALKHGKNRLEYSQSRLRTLNPELQALWAALNQDEALARRLLSQQEPGLIGQTILINLSHRSSNRDQSIQSYLSLDSQFPNNSVVAFNLAQLYGEAQDLASSDRYRNRLSNRDYLQLLGEYQRRDRRLLFERPKSVAVFFLIRLKDKLFQTLTPSSWTDLNWFSLARAILPWLILIALMKTRRRASGLCSFTGEPTPSVFVNLTPLAEKMTYQAEKVDGSERQKYLQKRRDYERRRSDRIRFWSWLFSPSYQVFEAQLFRAFFLAFVIWSLFVLSLPFSARAKILDFASAPKPGVFSEFQFSVAIFVIALLLHYFVGRASRRKAEA